MKASLRTLLEQDYQVDLVAQKEDDRTGIEAFRRGDVLEQFSLSFHARLPDTCWALERWDEARRWYRHNAQVLGAIRAYHLSHTPNWAFEEHLPVQATQLVRAGCMEEGRQCVVQALELCSGQPGSRLIESRLGLHGAQAGLDQLAQHALAIIEARVDLPGSRSAAAQRVRSDLHYEPAQVSLLLGRWEEMAMHLQSLHEAAQLTRELSEPAFPHDLQRGLVNAAWGLNRLESMRFGRIRLDQGRAEARQAFEAAMLAFYAFAGYNDVNVYMMRLNTRFADELAVGHPIDPTPFATKSCINLADTSAEGGQDAGR